MDRKQDFRLSLQPPSFFAEALEQALAAGPVYLGDEVRAPCRKGSQRYALLQLFEEDARPHFFNLLVHVPQGEFTLALADAARELFSQLVVMDDGARALPSQYDENEELAAVVLYPVSGEAPLQYYSTLWNSEWYVAFVRSENSIWQCSGIYDPRRDLD